MTENLLLMKKEGGSFYFIIGAYIILYVVLIGKRYNLKNIGLYGDDGLAVFKDLNRPASEKGKKT